MTIFVSQSETKSINLKKKNKDMKTTKLTLTSRYFEFELNIRMDAEKAEKLMSAKAPMELINGDIDAVAYGFEPSYLTVSQVKKINSFFSKGDCNYFNDIDYCE